ncbi:MAG: hypothetical protein IJV39_03005 [Ruminococcus sp.]|nr:hypothetical protein [Ruminococcus sp.]
MKNSKVKSRIAAITMSTVLAVSSAFALTSVSASAASNSGTVQSSVSQTTSVLDKTAKLNTFAKAYYFKAVGQTSYGYDWTYTADNSNLKVKCSYDFTTHKYTFKITGTSYGLNHFVLKYKTSDKKWVSVKMTFFVDSQKNIIRQA